MKTIVRKILVMGLPGAGKTTLSKALVERLNAVHFNADEIRAEINRDLGFSVEDRIEQARRMGWLCDQIVKTGGFTIADFICPTPQTRAAFGEAFVVWVDRIEKGRYEDTNRLFVPPNRFDVRVTAEGTPEYWADVIARKIQPIFNPGLPTALFVGRWQPFHNGHKMLIEEGIRRVGQVCVAVRDVHGQDDKNPFSFEAVRDRVEKALSEHVGRFIVMPLPNISHVFYGRTVGYSIERIKLPESYESISATEIRKKIIPGLRPSPI
jgi:hypothetical protein